MSPDERRRSAKIIERLVALNIVELTALAVIIVSIIRCG